MVCLKRISHWLLAVRPFNAGFFLSPPPRACTLHSARVLLFLRSQARVCREGAWCWNWLLAPHETPCQVTSELSLGASDMTCDPMLMMLAGMRKARGRARFDLCGEFCNDFCHFHPDFKCLR